MLKKSIVNENYLVKEVYFMFNSNLYLNKNKCRINHIINLFCPDNFLYNISLISA